MAKKSKKTETESIFYPPVVAVLGHVDHGKTSLLDAIRKSSIAEREHGGITQKIGASRVEIEHDGKKRSITFIDTPGHETFSKMRSRGAQAADIALLIIASTEGIKPQTKESIELLKASKIPFIVVLTKSDLEGKNPEKVKGELAKEGIMVEGLGGNVPVIEVSAKTGLNVKELLDLILLVYEMNGYKTLKSEVSGIVIESKLDPKAGPKATIVVKSGQIFPKDTIYCEEIPAKIRMLLDTNGKQVGSATLGDAVEVLGFEKVPPVGGIVSATAIPSKEVEKIVSEVSEDPLDFLSETSERKLSVMVVADSLGSLEAIIETLPKDIVIVAKKTGEITSSDVTHAKSTKSIILGFNVKIAPQVLNQAKTEKVLMKNYTIIYELISEISDVLQGKIDALQEEILGVSKVLASFPYERTKVLGIRVEDGRVARGDKVRIVRGDEIIGESTISSIRRGKDQISKVEKGLECGIIIAPLLDFTIGDMVLSHD